MRDVVAAIAAIALLLGALSMATRLQTYRRRRLRAVQREIDLGRTVIAEIPAGDDLMLVSEDAQAFYWLDAVMPKDAIMAVRVLVNGVPIAEHVASRHAAAASRATGAKGFEDRPEGIARDRWDVAVVMLASTTMVACGDIRERVSQELARAVFDAVKADIDRRDHHSVSAVPAR